MLESYPKLFRFLRGRGRERREETGCNKEDEADNANQKAGKLKSKSNHIASNQIIWFWFSQDSYTRAIGGSFEDDYTGEERGMVPPVGGGGHPGMHHPPQQVVQQVKPRSFSSSPRMPRKQESYLMAVGEMSPETEVRFFTSMKTRLKKVPSSSTF